ncbi:MAG TPA: chemotaxis protein CheB, partial [Gammaproteobacteria bacterium]|nr:chemotaxis protein CheB [Gammaproteobacteria bacterium]
MSFPIVGIGASAGGLEAISELLASLPAESGLALLLVQHLDPGHESLLAEILAKKTAMPVSKVTEGMVVEPNRLYVIPHNASMTITDGLLRLQSRNPAQGKHMPIDVLFHSLAEDQGPNAIGVVLSGGGSDGALGLQEIKGAGGITFAQDETSARFSDMPRAAIRLGCVDFILAPAGIGRELVRIARHPYLNGVEPAAEAADSGEPTLKKVFRLLWTTCGMDFSHYKRGTVQRRMALHKLDVI